MGDGRAEEGHDSIAHDLVHRALKAVDCLHHSLEHGVEDLARFFRVAVGEELHRAFEVGKEDRDLLALAFERALGREDPVCEVFRCVRARGNELGGFMSGRCSECQRLTTFLTELVVGRIGSSALLADAGKLATTFGAEFGVPGNVLLAPRTVHASPLRGSRTGTIRWVPKA